MLEKYSATLVIGRVVAHIQLSSSALCIGSVDNEEQWVSFTAEQVHIPLAEHAEWNVAWQAAWKTYLQKMKEQEQEEEQFW